mmetsp:Transcript_4431/g.10615  ORF Transcript_4431/g.10615 Transcript_4431/m.10615 type:complete len:104 (+) Transcript_4431:573-884(+)
MEAPRGAEEAAETSLPESFSLGRCFDVELFTSPARLSKPPTTSTKAVSVTSVADESSSPFTTGSRSRSGNGEGAAGFVTVDRLQGKGLAGHELITCRQEDREA